MKPAKGDKDQTVELELFSGWIAQDAAVCFDPFGMAIVADCRICCKLNLSYNFYKHTRQRRGRGSRRAHTQKITDSIEGSLPSRRFMVFSPL